jgi:hypothetical protein
MFAAKRAYAPSLESGMVWEMVSSKLHTFELVVLLVLL